MHLYKYVTMTNYLFPKYFTSGNKKVVINTWASNVFAPESKFQLTSAEANDLESSILCETG